MKKFLFSIICTLLPILASAQEPYAVLSDNNTVLTFYYDDQKAARGGVNVGPFEFPNYEFNESTREYYTLNWGADSRNIERIVFNPSFANCSTITSTEVWFCGCKKVKNIEGLEYLNTSHVTDMDQMFWGCKALESIDLSHFNTSSVITMQFTFSDCSSLTNLDLSGFTTDNVTDMYGIFSGCSNLTSLDLSGLKTDKVTRMGYMFDHCSSLTNLNLTGIKTDNVNDMGDMFSDCYKLASLDVSGFNTEHVKEMSLMFAGCSSLTNLDLSNFDTSNLTDMTAMFHTCFSLTTLNLSSFNTANVRRMNALFYHCYNLRTIYVGNNWSTANVSEGDDMFYECTSLVGGAGTTFNPNHTDVAFAHIDSENDPGYLTGATSGDEPYWQELQSTISYGTDVMLRARNNSNVDPWMVEELEMFLERADEMYNEHTASEQEVRHMIEELNWIIREIEEAMNNSSPDDPHSHGDASFDGLTAWVNGSSTLDDAFASVGGRSEAAKTIAAIVWNGDDALTAEMLDGITNPNLLVYVTEASKAPSGVQNVVINGTAAEIILTDASGNNNFYCPQSFTAQSISYTRNFSQTTQIDVCQGWETISLPFTVQSIRHQTNGALVPFGAGNNGYPFWLRQLSNSGLSRATAIEANRPYLICMPNNTVYPSNYNQAGNITFSATNVTVPVTSDQTASGAGVTLRPAFQQVAQSSSVYALNVGEARGEYPEGSVFERNYREIRPFQAYTSHGSGTRFITVSSMGGGDDGFTGIESIDSEDTDDNGTWHTLDGRRLEGKPVKKGVYIKDGRKYIIK